MSNDEYNWSLFSQREKDYNVENYKGILYEDELGKKYRWVTKTYDEVELLHGYVFEDEKSRKYRNVRWSVQTKTLVYEMFYEVEKGKWRWEGVFHGRVMKEFLAMKRGKP